MRMKNDPQPLCLNANEPIEFELSDEVCAGIERILEACDALESAGLERPRLPESALNIGGDFALVQARRVAVEKVPASLREAGPVPTN